MGTLKHAPADSNSPFTPSRYLTVRPAWAMSDMQCAMTLGDGRY
jgi:hypothetical protein